MDKGREPWCLAWDYHDRPQSGPDHGIAEYLSIELGATMHLACAACDAISLYDKSISGTVG